MIRYLSRRRRHLIAGASFLLAVATLACSPARSTANAVLDIRGSWDMVAVAGTTQYPQTLQVTSEDLSGGTFSGTDVGAGRTFTVTGTISGGDATFTTTGGGYTSHAKARIAGSATPLMMSGTFTDSNNVSGTFTAKRTTTGGVATAHLQGAWDLTVTVDAITGPPSQHPMAIGHNAVDRVWFQSDCSIPGHCTLQIWGPTGTDSQQTAYYVYYGKTSGFQGPPVSIPIMQSGDTYTADVPIGGFGGQVPCYPQAGNPAPSQQLTLRVTAAGAGSLATTVVGSETFDSGWGCTGGNFTGWNVTHLSIVGHPAGFKA